VWIAFLVVHGYAVVGYWFIGYSPWVQCKCAGSFLAISHQPFCGRVSNSMLGLSLTDFRLHEFWFLVFHTAFQPQCVSLLHTSIASFENYRMVLVC